MSDFTTSSLGPTQYNVTWRTRTSFVVISLFFLFTKFHRTFSILTLVVVVLNLYGFMCTRTSFVVISLFFLSNKIS
jgi:hypothetical protein